MSLVYILQIIETLKKTTDDDKIFIGTVGGNVKQIKERTLNDKG
jgi:hypothetical protein